MAGYAQSKLAPGFKNQGGWLIFFGILEIAISAGCALMLLLTLFSLALSALLPQAPPQAMSCGRRF